jgi:hypothetical protein
LERIGSRNHRKDVIQDESFFNSALALTTKRCLLHDMIIPGLTICGFSVILAMASFNFKKFYSPVVLISTRLQAPTARNDALCFVPSTQYY